jgi:hypothetical protein
MEDPAQQEINRKNHMLCASVASRIAYKNMKNS